MRTLPRVLVLALLLPLAGCPDKKEEPTTRVTREHKTASEGLREAMPTSEGNPANAAIKNMERTMIESEGRQDRHLDKAAAAGSQE